MVTLTGSGELVEMLDSAERRRLAVGDGLEYGICERAAVRRPVQKWTRAEPCEEGAEVRATALFLGRFRPLRTAPQMLS